LNTQRWRLITKIEDVEPAVMSLNGPEYVVKAQIHAGGRGQGYFIENNFKGGVHVVSTPGEVLDVVKKMLGNTLVTKQTGKQGVKVSKIMIAQSIQLHKELYVAILMDRKSQGPVIVVSPKGGMDIERVAEESPDMIFKEPIDITKGILPEQLERLTTSLGIYDDRAERAKVQISRLYDLFLKTDSTQVEINPFAFTPEGKLYCVDAKLNFDDNAAFRHKDIFAYRDTTEEDPREVAASKFDLNYVGMKGNIGCMVNGAGLAMATMDIIQMYGGSPANFLDVGGSANVTQVTEAFRIISSDPQVKAILVNIFGGIMKCDTIAEGVISACKQLGLKVPLVVRLAGTNVEKGNELLRQSGFNIVSATDLDDAAKRAVKCLN